MFGPCNFRSFVGNGVQAKGSAPRPSSLASVCLLFPTLEDKMATITIKGSDYHAIMTGTSGNGIADTIPDILRQKMREGYEILVVEDLTGTLTSRHAAIQ